MRPLNGKRLKSLRKVNSRQMEGEGKNKKFGFQNWGKTNKKKDKKINKKIIINLDSKVWKP